ncbi:MAG: hypothetical protein IKY83_04900, partial [Proteobacteria bacterium]|nr:hypothetical protein [Pseudomonadota bacterium]
KTSLILTRSGGLNISKVTRFSSFSAFEGCGYRPAADTPPPRRYVPRHIRGAPFRMTHPLENAAGLNRYKKDAFFVLVSRKTHVFVPYMRSNGRSDYSNTGRLPMNHSQLNTDA